MANPNTLIEAGLITYRRLDHWVRRGYLRPDDNAPGSGHSRSWSADELRVAERMARLVNAGLIPEQAASIARLPAGRIYVGFGITIEVA